MKYQPLGYSQHTWEKGQIITADKLNHLEQGIYNSSARMDILGPAAENGPISTDIASAISSKTTDEDKQLIRDSLVTAGAIMATRGTPDGIAPLNVSKIIPAEFLPSYVDDILEYDAKSSAQFDSWPEWESNTSYAVGDQVKVTDGLAVNGYICKTATEAETFNINEWNEATTFPEGSTDEYIDDGHEATGPEKGKIYLDKFTGRTYRWSGSEYVEVGVIHLDYADTSYPTTDPATINWDKYYIKKVTQNDGQISVEHALFSPSLDPTGGTKTNAQKLNLTVGGNSMATPIELTKATEGTEGVYGVTRLSNATNSEDQTIAATPYAVNALRNAVNQTISGLDYNDNNLDSNNDEIAAEGTSFGADTTKFVHSVTETDGKIKVIHRSFSPSVSITNNSSSIPTINVSVGGNAMATPPALPVATSSQFGVVAVGNHLAVNNGTISGNYSISDTYDSSTNPLATVATVRGAIESLDGGTIEEPGANKTISSISEANGQISVSFQDIVITKDKISDLAEWVKASSAPVYTAADVGALPDTTVIPSIAGLAQDTNPTFTISSEITFTDGTNTPVTFTLADLAALKQMIPTNP